VDDVRPPGLPEEIAAAIAILASAEAPYLTGTPLDVGSGFNV
jgi:NAD(P)-dependent dehydrogenase (short-subunit alcohol dehydrogenase family)